MAPRLEKKAMIDFPIDLDDGGAVKMVGRWCPQAMAIASRPDLNGNGPPGFAHLQVADGVFEDGVLVAPPNDWPGRDYCLFLSFSQFKDEAGLQEPYALLRGAFGPYLESGWSGAGVSCLGIMYTDRETEIENLARQLGTVDRQATLG
jgi:hypothetical protein